MSIVPKKRFYPLAGRRFICYNSCSIPFVQNGSGRKVVSVVLSVVMTVTAPLGMLLGKSHAKIARAQADCRVSFAAISDTHLRGNFKPIFQGMLELGLRDMANAQDKPDDYRNLIVRIAGFSAVFVELPKAVQDDFITRTEHAL